MLIKYFENQKLPFLREILRNVKKVNLDMLVAKGLVTFPHAIANRDYPQESGFIYPPYFPRALPKITLHT